MLPDERKEGSPRFGKLHFPVGLWINSPKKRLAKMSRRWPSAGSVRSTSSDPPSGRTTAAGVDPPPPPSSSSSADPRPAPKPKPPRHKRLSHLFHRTPQTPNPPDPHPLPSGGRWGSEKKLPELLHPHVGGDDTSGEEPPCILKIFWGGGPSRGGANYKSVLATPRCRARRLVREALERYGLDPRDAPLFALCDVLGRPTGAVGDSGGSGGWQGEHLREVGDLERPLVLQELWKPKAGWSRRFEIRRREELRGSGDREEAESPGLPLPPRRLQRNRSRAASGGVGGGGPDPSPHTAPPHAPSREGPMRRSVSDLNLSTRRRQRQALSLAGEGGGDGTPRDQPPETPGTPPGGGDPLPESGEGAGGGASPELPSQGLIRPPRDRPYFLLLQGWGKEDFVIYVMTRPQHVFGRLERRGEGREGVRCPPDPTQGGGPGTTLTVDTFLSAPDLLPRHLLVREDPPRDGDGDDPRPTATARPFRGAAATLNGTPLVRGAPLATGDLLGLGQHVLLLYRDPRAAAAPAEGERVPRPRWLPPPRTAPGLRGMLGCAGCGRSPRERREELRAALESPRAELRYRPPEEEALLRDILRLPAEEGDTDTDTRGEEGEDLGGLAPAFLLGLCLDHAAREFPPGHLPRLLSRVAAGLRDTVGEKIKEIGDQQPESESSSDPQAPPTAPPGVPWGLKPLLLWLANAVELLNLAQGHVLELEKELEIEGPCLELQRDLEVCDEALAVLDEVIMSTFQQSVYYLTKSLYWALPALLDTNPFAGAGTEPRVGPEPGALPEGLRPPLSVFGGLLELSRAVQLHPDLVAQTFGYLFFFCNASLFNTLMERGSAGPFFQWWVGVRVRTNLDLVLDGLGALGLGDIAGEFFRKLSATANLLCTPRGTLAKASWSRLRSEFPALAPAQLHHMLSHYQLGPGRDPPPAWEPPPEERQAATSGDIFEGFSDHPPLLLPTRGFRLPPPEPLGPGGLLRPLLRLRRRLWELEGGLPANQRGIPIEETP